MEAGGGVLNMFLKNSDTVIFLDINRFVCLARAVWRSIKSYGKTRADMAAGCKEQFDINFAKWILEYPAKNKPEILRRLNNLPPEKKIIILRSRKEVEAFLNAA